MAPLPVETSWAGSAVLNGLIYVAGGVSPVNFPATDTLFGYDPTANTWTTLANLPDNLYGPAVGAVNGTLYVAGGLNSAGTTVNSLYAYNPGTNTWSTSSTTRP